MTHSIAPDLEPLSAAEALDAAFAGNCCELVRPDGRRRRLETHRWAGSASPSDLALFVDRCSAPTLDLGCGPGRLSGALHDRGIPVLGVDVSAEAVRQTRARGADALVGDLFAPVPGAQTWGHVLLADGNIGLGGRPVRLLRRVAELMAPHGRVLVEVAATGGVSIHHGIRLHVGGRVSAQFDWATVGLDAIDQIAADAGLFADDVAAKDGRCVATLRRSGATAYGQQRRTAHE